MTENVIDELGSGVLKEFFIFMTGRHLGRGMSRHVFDHPTDPTKIIKVENSAACFQNVIEWKTWETFNQCPDVKKWLAPCHSISHSGTFLIMEKAQDICPEEIPEKLPYFLTDHKIENYGRIGKQIVCRDYGLLTLNPDMKMRKWQGSRI